MAFGAFDVRLIIGMRWDGQMRGTAVGLLLVLCASSVRAAPSEEFSAALASAPPVIRSLRCGDVIAAGSGDTVATFLREWLSKTMTSIADSGISNDQ